MDEQTATPASAEATPAADAATVTADAAPVSTPVQAPGVSEAAPVTDGASGDVVVTPLAPDPLNDTTRTYMDPATYFGPHLSPLLGAEVFYVLPDGRNAGQPRPAKVIRVWGEGDTPTVNLAVFVDGYNDKDGILGACDWRTSVPYSAAYMPGTWFRR